MSTAIARIGRALAGASTFEAREGDLSKRKVVAFLLWRAPLLLLIIGVAWAPLRGLLWGGGFGWIGGACTWNAFKCGRTHCALMGPLFLGLSGLSIATEFGALALQWQTIGLAGVGSVILGYLPEWLGRRYLRSNPVCDSESGC